MSQKIQVLSEALASQVAAGEVVERPASVVKELVENSIDAGARRIDVLVRRGGLSLIRVVDDGCGMGRADALLSFERHATSKLRSKDDLSAILTMGFRGEALPSIASVSRFTLTTREHGALCGTEVQIDGGKLLSVMDAGEAPGTCIEVRSLFGNIPARRKFLRAEDTEFSHIEQQVRVRAVAHSEIGFSLTRDDRVLFHLPGGGDLRERISGLAGADTMERLLPVPRQTSGGVTVWGFIGEAGLHRSSRALLFTFLNRRPVESPVFTYALRGGYGEALPRGQWPVAFLFIEIDPREVDVNVHPAKREVRFRDGSSVQNALMQVIGDVLRRGRVPVTSAAVRRTPEPRPLAPPVVPPVAPPPAPRWTLPPEQTPLIAPRDQHALRHDWAELPASVPVESQTTAAAGDPKPLPFRVLAPLSEAWWLLEGDEGLVVLDVRAAHERILYEEARDRAARGHVTSQQLLTAITLKLSPREFEFLRPHLPALRRMGVGAEEFGGHTVVIDSLPPHWQNDGDAGMLVSALIADLRAAGDRAPQRRLDDDTIAAAVARRAGTQPGCANAHDAGELMRRLLACDMPYCCPDGRATLVQISFQELARKFGKR